MDVINKINCLIDETKIGIICKIKLKLKLKINYYW